MRFVALCWDAAMVCKIAPRSFSKLIGLKDIFARPSSLDLFFLFVWRGGSGRAGFVGELGCLGRVGEPAVVGLPSLSGVGGLTVGV